MDDPLILLHSALGQPGSGRTRYGAAMELHRRGLLSDAQLEVYRIASAHDGRDALVMLSERHLPLPPPALQSGQIAIADLVAQIITYMGELSGDGCVEARQGVARWCGPVTLPVARPSDVVDRHLTGALAALSGTHPALATAIARAAPLLRWGPYDRYPPAEIGEEFATGHTFASIIGEDAPMAAQDFDLGLFLIAPNVLYRDHCHRAPELYAPLTGPHGWRFGPDRPLVVKPAHDPVWNPPYRPHLTKVGPTPFLCIFCWTADVNEVATVLPASDWPELQALRL